MTLLQKLALPRISQITRISPNGLIRVIREIRGWFSLMQGSLQQFMTCHSDDRGEEESQVRTLEIPSFGRLRTGSRFAPSE